MLEGECVWSGMFCVVGSCADGFFVALMFGERGEGVQMFSIAITGGAVVN